MQTAIDLDELAHDSEKQQASVYKRVVSLNEVKAMAEKQRLLEEEVFALETQVIVKKQELKQVAERDLPELLNVVGLPSITLLDGSVIKVEENISASIGEDNREAAHKFLRDVGADDLIKNAVTVTFGKGEDNDAQRLLTQIKFMADEGSLHYGTMEQKETVHAATLKAFVKERLREGKPLPAETFKLFIRQIAVLKRPKVKA